MHTIVTKNTSALEIENLVQIWTKAGMGNATVPHLIDRR